MRQKSIARLGNVLQGICLVIHFRTNQAPLSPCCRRTFQEVSRHNHNNSNCAGARRWIIAIHLKPCRFARPSGSGCSTSLDEELRGLSNRGALNPEQLDALRRWNKEAGGRRVCSNLLARAIRRCAAGVMEQVVLAEEMHRAGHPPPSTPSALPTLRPPS